MKLIPLAAFILYCLGSILFFSRADFFRRFATRGARSNKVILVLKTLAVQTLSFSIIFMLSRSANISLPISIVVSLIPKIYARRKEQGAEEARRKSWPLVIDQLSTATASGVPMHAALIEMASRGPFPIREEFVSLKRSFLAHGSLEKALEQFVETARIRGSKSHVRRANQLKSTILIARDYGGQEVGPILRNLSTHLRRHERTYDEIAIRQGWIKNGAILASVTPWLLLIILSFHSQTIIAFNSPSGRVVLLSGLVATGLAYKWISSISDSVAPKKR
jgi:tight adherence protein B